MCSTLFLWPGKKFAEGLSNSSDKQKTKTAIAEGLSNCRLEYFSRIYFIFHAKSQVFRPFFLGYVRNILHFCWVYANLATQEKRPGYLTFGVKMK